MWVCVNIDYDANSYELFSYRPTNCFDIKAAGINISDPTAGYKVIEKYSVASGVKLAVRAQNPLATTFFLPPNPDTYIWLKGDPIISINPGYVDLSTVDGSLKMAVQITAGGQVGY